MDEPVTSLHLGKEYMADGNLTIANTYARLSLAESAASIAENLDRIDRKLERVANNLARMG